MSKSVEHLRQHQFKPGQSGNPGGRSNLPPDILEARKYNAIEVERVIHELFEMSVAAMEEVATNERTPTLKALLASMMMHALKRGDFQRLEWILTRAGLGLKGAEDPFKDIRDRLASLSRDEFTIMMQAFMAKQAHATVAQGVLNGNTSTNNANGDAPGRGSR